MGFLTLRITKWYPQLWFKGVIEVTGGSEIDSSDANMPSFFLQLTRRFVLFKTTEGIDMFKCPA